MFEELVTRLREPCQYENCVLCQDAADAIENLQGQLSVCLEGTKARFLKNDDGTTELRFENQWILVTERLPEYGKSVLCYFANDDYGVNHIIDEEDGEWLIDGVTAWQPLPEPPEEEK